MIQNPIWSLFRVVRRNLLFLTAPFFTDYYMRSYTKYLQRCGLDIADYDEHGYIHPSVWFDSSKRYSLIKIGRAVTLSRDVILLTHDYSIRNAINAFEMNAENVKYKYLKSITIGDNCFIGARAILLPGTEVGDDVIIGAGSVVKGNIPSKTVWGGSPARQLSTLEEYYVRHKKGRIIQLSSKAS